MSAFEWVQFGLALTSAIVLPVVILVARHAAKLQAEIARLRQNDLHALETSVIRLEAKLDAHITYHLEKPR